ncbi:pseudouridine synthase [Rubellimicrobium roseum]|uniref:Pseudouridine synthase n=1 Tax=Rubellimicrobium roseum TaxID=687525 RepID=A0A5C4NCD1_9RHOB|nr:pseudouridine synthase [Rubellimicrobium roseum]TNC71530.1 pseudouridine synthase [Rubellimicrobium roseum]
MSTDDKTPDGAPGEGERIAKVLSRAGVASRRDAERLVLEGRVTVNGTQVTSPATNVTDKDRLAVDGQLVAAAEATRLWLYHKPAGLVTTERDEEGRETVFDSLPEDMPRVMSVGRLDLTSEGLLLLTNDGEIKRKLELPSTGWSRRYRVRIHGNPTPADLEPLRQGVTVEGIDYQPMEVAIDRQQGSNCWLTITLREGKNREIRNSMEHLGYTVNRLIRVSYGPFQLGDLPVGDVEEVRPKIVRDQLGLGKPEPVTRSRRKPEPSDMPVFDDEAEDRPARAPLATRRPEGATVRREMKPRLKAKGEAREDSRPPRKPGKPSMPGSFTRPRTWMRDGEEPPATRDERPRRDFGDKPRSGGYKSHDRGEGDRPRRAEGFRSHADGERPRRDEGDRPRRDFGDKPRRDFGDRPQRSEGDRGPRRSNDDRPPRRFDNDRSPRKFGDDRPPRREGDDRPPRRFDNDRPRPPREGGEDRPRSFKPRREDGDRAPRPFKPRFPREGGDDNRPARSFKPREGGDDRGPRPFKPRFPREGGEDRGPRREGEDRPARPFKPRGDDERRPPRDGDRPAKFSREGGGFAGRGGDRPEGGRPPRKGPPRDGGFKPRTGGFDKGRPAAGGRPGFKPRKG